MAKKTKKLEVELFQVRAQLERTSSAKLDEMLSLQKSASNRTGLDYDFSSLSIALLVLIFLFLLLIILKLRTTLLKMN